MGRLDLDALAGEPLIVELGGKEYRLELTVDDLVAVDQAQKSGIEAEGWELFRAIVKAAGIPEDVLGQMTIPQVKSLAEAFAKRFFPEAVAEVN